MQVLKMQEKLRIPSRRVHSNFQKTKIDTKEINAKCKSDAFYSIWFQWKFFRFLNKISYPKMPFHNMIVLRTLFVVWEWRIFFFVPPFTVQSTISPCFIYEIQIIFDFKNLKVILCYTNNSDWIRISNFTYDLYCGHRMVDTEIGQILLLLLHLYMPIRQIILDSALLLSLYLLQ